MPYSKKKLIISVVLVGVLVIVFSAGFVLFLLVIQDEQKKFLSTRREVARLEQERSQVRDLEKLLMVIKQDKEKLEMAFVDDAELVKFIEEIELVGRFSDVSVSIKSLEPRKESIDLPLIKFDVIGDLDDVLRFTARIESLPYQIEVISLFVNPVVRNKLGNVLADTVGLSIDAHIHNFVQ